MAASRTEEPSESAVAGDDELRAVDGRVPGRRGMATRERLLEHTNRLLSSTSYRDLKVVDIAREAGTSPATFYQYFPDAESAVLALADRLIGEGGERLTLPFRAATWEGRAAYDACEQVAAAFLEFWDDHSALMAVIDLAALEGDQRFRDCRTHLLSQFTVLATEVITEQQRLGVVSSELNPMATAVALVSMLAHVAAHQHGIDWAGVDRAQMRDAMARLIYTGVTGRTPPS
ncbi:MAG: TetR family transcriptional regulator [Microthrixaceae bacterium]